MPASEDPRTPDQGDAAIGPVDEFTVQATHRRDIPAEVVDRRALQAVADRADQARFAAAVEAHIAAHLMAVDYLRECHQWVADYWDFDLIADSRPAALWQMAGRSIGIARLICDSLRLGYTAEVLHLARALHEADRLLDVFALAEGTDLLRKWLADDGNDWVRPGEVRKALAEFEDRLATKMTELGLPTLEKAQEKSKSMYDLQSRAAHHRRKWTQDAVLPELRTMIQGPSHHWGRRAVTTAAMLAVVEESVMSVGDALSPFFPGGWYDEHIKPFLTTFETIRIAQPLEPPT